MTAPKLWHVIYWRKGESPSSALVLSSEPKPYREARASAKRCRYMPAFFGCVLDVRPA